MSGKDEFSMQKDSIVHPFSRDWFNTVSFGDVIKLFFALCSLIGLFVTMNDKIDNIKEASKNSAIEWERRFTELRESDLASRNEIMHSIDRLSDRLDGFTGRTSK